MTIIKYLRLPFLFDVNALQGELASLTQEHWLPHYQKFHYEGDWSAIPLRSVDGRVDSILVSPHADASYADTMLLDSSPYIKNVLSQFQCTLKGVRLLRLGAGAHIKEHRDAELAYEQGEVRIHVPVITNDLVEFYVDEERIVLKEGECWYLNFNLPHAVENKGTTDRIHLVIDAEVNDWMRDIFSRGDLKKEIEKPTYDDETRASIIRSLREMNTPVSHQLADEMEKNSTGPLT